MRSSRPSCAPIAGSEWLRLGLEHAQGVGQRGHVLPAQLQVVAEAAPDQMQMVVVEAGDQNAAAQLDGCGFQVCQAQDVLSRRLRPESGRLDGCGAGQRLLAVHGVDIAVVQNEIGCGHICFFAGNDC